MKYYKTEWPDGDVEYDKVFDDGSFMFYSVCVEYPSSIGWTVPRNWKDIDDAWNKYVEMYKGEGPQPVEITEEELFMELV